MFRTKDLFSNEENIISKDKILEQFSNILTWVILVGYSEEKIINIVKRKYKKLR